jgi:hypothetical protein
MTDIKGDVWFLASCVELYKDEKGLSGQETFNYLKRTGAVDFITRCWEALHTTGPLYIIDYIKDMWKYKNWYNDELKDNNSNLGLAIFSKLYKELQKQAR